MAKPIFEIDGDRINSFEDFVTEIRSVLRIPWNGNLDAFNDYMSGGMGTPDGGFVLRWINSDRSRVALGHRDMVRRLERILQTCHPSWKESIQEQIRAANEGKGQTTFDLLTEIIRVHGTGGMSQKDGVDLELA